MLRPIRRGSRSAAVSSRFEHAARIAVGGRDSSSRALSGICRLSRAQAAVRSSRRAIEQLAESSAVSGLSTYTRARDSSALFTSKDGFSVVAPMKISVPSSTYGRKVSCWDLLKRCTSSRNSTVSRVPRKLRACSTTARMSLMPASTAESAMNSRIGAARHQARKRGLAGPGRPPQDHRVRPAGLERAAQRRARTRADATGRRIHRGRAVAAGRPAAGRCRRRPPARHLVSRPITSTPRRRRERKQVRCELGIARRVGEGQLRDLVELVREEHRGQLAVLVESDAHQLEIRVRVLGNELKPAAVRRSRAATDVELVAHRAGSGQQHRGRAGEGGIHVAHVGLREILVVEPDLLAVGQNQLLGGFRIIPAKLSRALQIELAGGAAQHLAVAVIDGLREVGRPGRQAGQIFLDLARGRGCRCDRGRARQADAAGAQRRELRCNRRRRSRATHSSGGAAPKISRAPFGCSGPTRPAASIASTRRAARL